MSTDHFDMPSTDTGSCPRCGRDLVPTDDTICEACDYGPRD